MYLWNEFSPHRLPRRWWRAAQGVVLATGAPIGWLALEQLFGVGVRRELVNRRGLYTYLAIGTGAAFATFGYVVGLQEERLEELADTDAVTGLRNARYFRERCNEELAISRRTRRPLAMAIIDIDHFKRINDRHGHATGNRVLGNVADAIAQVVRSGETIARIGGDEFGLLLPGDASDAAQSAAHRVLDAASCSETNLCADVPPLQVTVSIGVASVLPNEATTAEALYNAADTMLYKAKHHGRHRVMVLSESDDSAVDIVGHRTPTTNTPHEVNRGK